MTANRNYNSIIWTVPHMVWISKVLLYICNYEQEKFMQFEHFVNTNTVSDIYTVYIFFDTYGKGMDHIEVH